MTWFLYMIASRVLMRGRRPATLDDRLETSRNQIRILRVEGGRPLELTEGLQESRRTITVVSHMIVKIWTEEIPSKEVAGAVDTSMMWDSSFEHLEPPPSTAVPYRDLPTDRKL
jgi:hypothetical protein